MGHFKGIRGLSALKRILRTNLHSLDPFRSLGGLGWAGRGSGATFLAGLGEAAGLDRTVRGKRQRNKFAGQLASVLGGTEETGHKPSAYRFSAGRGTGGFSALWLLPCEHMQPKPVSLWLGPGLEIVPYLHPL